MQKPTEKPLKVYQLPLHEFFSSTTFKTLNSKDYGNQMLLVNNNCAFAVYSYVPRTSLLLESGESHQLFNNRRLFYWKCLLAMIPSMVRISLLLGASTGNLSQGFIDTFSVTLDTPTH